MSLLDEFSGKLSVPKVKPPSLGGGIDAIKGRIKGKLSLDIPEMDLDVDLSMPEIPVIGTSLIKGNGPPPPPKEMGSAFEISNFLASSAINKGLHYQHNFIVQVDQPLNFKHDVSQVELTWNASEVAVPGIVLGVDTLKINGRPRFFASERAEQDLKITFIEDKNMSCRRFFDEWMSIIFNPFDKGRNYPDDFKAPFIKVHTTDQNGQSSFSDTFMDVFPFDISDMNYSVSAYGISKTSVTFKFKSHILEGPTDNNITGKVDLH